MGFQRETRQQALSGIKRITRSIKNLESNQAFPIQSVEGVTSSPPTDTEITGLFDIPANIGQDMIGLIKDTINSRYWIVWTDAVNWFYIQVFLAV